MKKITLAGATIALAMAASSAFAANSLNAGTFGLNIPVITTTATTNTNINSPIISGRYFVTRDMAVLGGLGFISGGPNGNATTTFALMGGVRKYLKVDDFAPFVGASLQYESTSTAPSATTSMTIAAEGGAEYFLAKQFSVEGKVILGYQSRESGAIKSTYFGTTTANLGLNFYF